MIVLPGSLRTLQTTLLLTPCCFGLDSNSASGYCTYSTARGQNLLRGLPCINSLSFYILEYVCHSYNNQNGRTRGSSPAILVVVTVGDIRTCSSCGVQECIFRVIIFVHMARKVVLSNEVVGI